MLLLAQKSDLILVVCDQIMKIAHFVPTIEKTPVERLAKLFRDHMWKLYGFTESIVINWGA